jgi:hypothetical protein
MGRSEFGAGDVNNLTAKLDTFGAAIDRVADHVANLERAASARRVSEHHIDRQRYHLDPTPEN